MRVKSDYVPHVFNERLMEAQVTTTSAWSEQSYVAVSLCMVPLKTGVCPCAAEK